MYADHEENISLQYVGAIPLVTADIWHTLIERSYYRLEPHTNDGTWRRQDTKVILVIFVLAGCGSCVKNHHVFEQIQTSVDHINGAAVYMVNCSRDAQLCKNQNISGFPTVVAYRGLNWLDSDQCLSEGSSTSQTYVRIDYHGVLTVHQVMAWFSEVTSDAVVNLQFAHRANNSKLSVQLTATVLPRQSRYLPHIPGKHAEYFYPYKCYRLACEYLYGQAACYTQYSDDVPKSEYSSDSHDLIVTKIVLSRNDGIRTTIMQLGRTLYNTFEEESSTGIHSFHRPHRYKLHHQQRCEDDHRSCTDLIIHFVRDHGRLPITHMTSQAFHMPHNLLFQDNLPVLVALVHQENITQESEFYQVLLSIAYQFYKEVIVVSVDVDEFPGWSGQFVPHGARHKFKENESHSFYTYPRLCVVRWNDHRHAAFFPPTKAAPTEDTATIEIDGFLITDKARVARATAESKDGDEAGSNPSKDRSSKTYKRSNDVLNRTAVENFLRQYLANPDQFITETEHF